MLSVPVKALATAETDHSNCFLLPLYFSLQVEDLREAVLKLAAADKLRAHGFLRSEQNLPKTNKRGATKAQKIIVLIATPVLYTQRMSVSSP